MERIIILIFTLIGFSVAAFSSVDECKTDIYFGNGVWNTKKQAEISRKELEERIIKREIIKGDPTLAAKYGTVKLAYNWSDGWDIDLVETFYQLKEAGQLSKKTFFVLMDELITKRAADLYGEDLKTMRNLLLQAITSHEQTNVDIMLEKYYNESFRYSHRVLLVSHSQGNLFANRVYDSIDPEGYKDYFANVQVASPASSVHAAKGTYITGWVDPIINPIPGSMKHNATLDGIGGHAFVAAYLDSKDTYQKIVQAIKEELAALDDPSRTPSQWKIVREPEDRSSCEAIRVEMVHRFDKSLAPIEDVYPFETNATLYRLYAVKNEDGINHYVIDRCGGKTIQEKWESKKDNECYLLDPLDDIIKLNNFVYFIRSGRPGGSIYTIRLFMCRADLQNYAASRKCVQIANGPSGDGYHFWDVFGEGPCQGYDRYHESKWAGTEYEGVFDDRTLTVVPFEKATGWLCDNYDGACCTCNNDNFKTYYQLSWSELFENAYNQMKGGK